MKLTTLLLTSISIFGLIFIALFFLSYDSSETVNIGVVTGLSGKDGLVGEWTQQGLELAKKEINEAGGVHGKNIELLYEDSQFTPQRALVGAKKLIDVDGVHSLITLSGASSALSILPYVNEQHVLQMEVICIVPACHTQDDYLVRVSGPPEDQSTFLANFIFDDLEKETVAILWINNDYGANQKETFIQNYKGEVLDDEAYDQGNTDFRTVLMKLTSQEPDSLFLIAHPVEIGYMLKQLGELGLEIPTVGTFTSQNPLTLQVAGDFAEGHYYAYFGIDFSTTKAQQFSQHYVEEYGAEPEVFATKSYDALYVLVEAMKGCDEDDSTCMRDNVSKIRNYEGVSNVLTFDSYGDLVHETFEMRTVRNGKFVSL